MAKNSLIRRAGASAQQAVSGREVQLPESLLGNPDNIGAHMLMSEEQHVHRRAEIRCSALRKFHEWDLEQAMKRGQQAQARRYRGDYNPGEPIGVYYKYEGRNARARFVKGHVVAEAQPEREGQVVVDRVWVAVNGRMLNLAKDDLPDPTGSELRAMPEPVSLEEQEQAVPEVLPVMIPAPEAAEAVRESERMCADERDAEEQQREADTTEKEPVPTGAIEDQPQQAAAEPGENLNVGLELAPHPDSVVVWLGSVRLPRHLLFLWPATLISIGNVWRAGLRRTPKPICLTLRSSSRLPWRLTTRCCLTCQSRLGSALTVQPVQLQQRMSSVPMQSRRCHKILEPARLSRETNDSCNGDQLRRR